MPVFIHRRRCPRAVSTRRVTPDDIATIKRFLAMLHEALADDDVVFGRGENDAIIAEFLEGRRGAMLLAEDDTGVLGLISISFNISD